MEMNTKRLMSFVVGVEFVLKCDDLSNFFLSFKVEENKLSGSPALLEKR